MKLGNNGEGRNMGLLYSFLLTALIIAAALAYVAGIIP